VWRLGRLRCNTVLLTHPDSYCIAGPELISDSDRDGNDNREPREFPERCAHRYVNGHSVRATDGPAIRNTDRFTNRGSHENSKPGSNGDAEPDADLRARQRRERRAGAFRRRRRLHDGNGARPHGLARQLVLVLRHPEFATRNGGPTGVRRGSILR
jgi:hypothetical protein